MSTQVCPVQRRNKKKIYSVENLSRFVDVEENLLTPALKGVRTRAQRGECAFYGYLGVEFPAHYRAFRNIHDSELASGLLVDGDFDMTSEGLINFIIAVGPIPSNLQNPILVRTDPDTGFVRGNTKWVNATKFRPLSARRALTFVNR